MVELIIWIAVLLFLLSVCVYFSRRILLTPQFVYVGGFIPQAIFSLYFVKEWEIDLCAETMFVLIGGTTLFVVASILFDRLFSRIMKDPTGITAEGQQNSIASTPIYIERWKILLLLAVQVIGLSVFIVYGVGNLSGATIEDKILVFNNTNKFGDVEDAIRFPFWVSVPRAISMFSCYVTGYILLHSIIFKYKQKKVLLSLTLPIGVLSVLATGGRIRIIGIIVSLVVQAYFMWGESIHWKKRISLRLIFKILLIGVIILVLFQWTLQFIGRSDNRSFLSYLGLYICAPLRNLDVFVRTHDFGCEISKGETLHVLLNDIGRTFGIPGLLHQYDLPSLRIHGTSFGNVYTLYYHYLHDGGHIAVILFVILEAFLTQILFHSAMRQAHRSRINVRLIVYSYILNSVFLGFFMERFYADLFAFIMVKSVVFWWFLSWFFTTRFRFSKKDIN